jgi:predicted DsbA family dithiol-disulfide isomerase
MTAITTATTSTATLTVEVWTDLGCPWCYLGKHRLDAAIAAVGADVRVVLHSFQLHPEALVGVVETVPDIAMRVHGISHEEAHRLEDRMTAMAAREGLPFTIDRPVSNTFDVHRLLHLAQDHGVGTAFFGDVEQEYFAGRLDPFDPDAMVQAAARHGIPETEVRRVLASDAYSAEVQADAATARALEVTGVPFMVFDGRFATAGAQTVAGYRQAIERAIAGATA